MRIVQIMQTVLGQTVSDVVLVMPITQIKQTVLGQTVTIALQYLQFTTAFFKAHNC